MIAFLPANYQDLHMSRFNYQWRKSFCLIDWVCRAKAIHPALVFLDTIHGSASWPWAQSPCHSYLCFQASSTLLTWTSGCPYFSRSIGTFLALDLVWIFPLKKFTQCLSFPTMTWASSIRKAIGLSPLQWVHPKIPNVCPAQMFRLIFFAWPTALRVFPKLPSFLFSLSLFHPKNYIMKNERFYVQWLIFQFRIVNFLIKVETIQSILFMAMAQRKLPNHNLIP